MTQDPFPLHKLRIPDLQEEAASIRLIAWVVAPGDAVICGERVAELLIDSVLFHLESDQTGTLQDFLVPTGARVHSGEVIAEIRVDRNSDLD